MMSLPTKLLNLANSNSLKQACYASLLFLSTAFLSGCQLSPNIDTKLDEYRQSLNRYQGLDLAAVSQRFPKFTLPSIKQRVQPLTQFDVSLIDFLSIQKCEIGYLVGEKNSILGKVMTHSQRLIYETNIIRAIETCDLGETDLAIKLKGIAKIKRAELNQAFANAFWGGEEIQRFFSVSNGYLPMVTSQLNFQDLNLALNQLVSISRKLHALPDLNNDQFEEDLKQIYHSEFGGKLLLTLPLITDYLEEISAGLDEIKPDTRFCQGPMMYLKQQFTAHYVQEIQPYMAKVNTASYSILASLEKIQKQSGELTPAMQDFLNQLSMENQNSLWWEYKKASLDHAKAWDRLLRTCDMF